MTSSRVFKTFAKFAPIAIGTISASGLATASIPDGVQQLSTITIHANTPAENTPWTTKTDRETLDVLQIQDWVEFSRRAEPGVNFNKQSQSINVRGLDENRITTRIDGIRQPYLNDGARGVKGGLSAFDFNTLWALSVIRGVDSSAGGSGALGAMLKLRTINPSDLLTDNKKFTAKIKTDASTQDDSTGINTVLAGRYNRTDWLIQAGVRQGEAQKNTGTNFGYGLNRSAPDPSDYLTQSYLLKLQQQFSATERIGLTGEYFRANNAINSMSAQGVGTPYVVNKNAIKDTTKRERLSLEYGYETAKNNNLIDKAHTQVYWQRVSLNSDLDAKRKIDHRARIIRGDPYRYGYPYGEFLRNNSMSEVAYGLDGEMTKTLGDKISHTLSMGGEWYATEVNQYSGGSDNCPKKINKLPQPFGPRACSVLHSNSADMPEINGKQWAIWMQDAVALGESGITVMPAIRYDYYQQNPVGTQGSAFFRRTNPEIPTSEGGQFSPKLLASWVVNENATIYAQYATGFNAPSATQLYSKFGSFGSYLNIGNPELKPEISRGYELGIKLGSEKNNASLTYFDNNYQNLIEGNVRVGPKTNGWQNSWATLYPLGVTSFENIEQARIFGVEARGQLALTREWKTWASMAWAVGKDLQTGAYLNSVAPLSAAVGLGYQQEQWGAHALLTAVAARTNVRVPEPSTALPIADYQTPGYGVMDLAAYWQPAAVEGLKVQIGIYNVLDQKYWNALNLPSAAAKPGALAQLTQRPLDLYSEPGRSYRLTVTYQY